MGSKLEARQLHSIAQQDQFDGVGRIFIAEAQRLLCKETLTFEDIRQLWQEYYPNEEVDHRQENMVLVYFDGKDTRRNNRVVLAEKLVLEAEKEPNYNEDNPEIYAATPTNEYLDPDEIPANKPGEDNIIW